MPKPVDIRDDAKESPVDAAPLVCSRCGSTERVTRPIANIAWNHCAACRDKEMADQAKRLTPRLSRKDWKRRAKAAEKDLVRARQMADRNPRDTELGADYLDLQNENARLRSEVAEQARQLNRYKEAHENQAATIRELTDQLNIVRGLMVEPFPADLVRMELCRRLAWSIPGETKTND